MALALDDPQRELKRAAAVLALPDIHTVTVGDWLAAATRAWGERWVA